MTARMSTSARTSTSALSPWPSFFSSSSSWMDGWMDELPNMHPTPPWPLLCGTMDGRRKLNQTSRAGSHASSTGNGCRRDDDRHLLDLRMDGWMDGWITTSSSSSSSCAGTTDGCVIMRTRGLWVTYSRQWAEPWPSSSLALVVVYNLTSVSVLVNSIILVYVLRHDWLLDFHFAVFWCRRSEGRT